MFDVLLDWCTFYFFDALLVCVLLASCSAWLLFCLFAVLLDCCSTCLMFCLFWCSTCFVFYLTGVLLVWCSTWLMFYLFDVLLDGCSTCLMFCLFGVLLINVLTSSRGYWKSLVMFWMPFSPSFRAYHSVAATGATSKPVFPMAMGWQSLAVTSFGLTRTPRT